MHWLSSLRLQMFGHKQTRPASKRAARKSKRSHALTLVHAMRHETLEERRVLSVNLVADLNAYTKSSNPANITDVSGTAFFTATTNSGNQELFKSDGTAGGTTELTFGTRLSNFGNLTSLNGKLFFSARDTEIDPVNGYNVYTLWASDGTAAGTTPFLAGGSPIDPYPGGFVGVAGGKLYFAAYDASNGLNDVWVSNGTSGGTHPLQPGNASAPNGASASQLTDVNGKAFFEDYDTATNMYDLWTSDGTAGGTVMVTDLTANQPTSFTAVGSELYFEMYDSANSQYALWKSNGTAAGTTQVADVGSGNRQFYDLTAFSGKLYFDAYDPTDAPNTLYAVWSSDGTTAHTGVFKFNGGTTPVEAPGSMVVFGTDLYFEGYDSTHGYSLWKSDGSSTNNATGTVQTGTATPFNYSTSQETVVGTELYFLAYNTNDASNYNYDLWKTDGTSSGTVPVQTGGFARNSGYLTASGGKLFFQAEDLDANNSSPHGFELWSSDGTNAGTAMATDINTTTFDSNPTNLVAVASEIFFHASTYAPVNGTYLWQSDGTAANTALVQTSGNVVPTSEANSIAVGNSLFFTGYGANGNDLWTSGTGLDSAVEMFPTGPNPFSSNFDSSDAGSFANLGGILYFGAYDASNLQYALWKSNGTAAGTTVVADLGTSGELYNLTVAGSNLFWDQYDSVNSTYALWEYNGSSASLVSDTGCVYLTAVGGSVFFQSYDYGTSEYALWTSNGTTTTNLMEFAGGPIYDLTAFNGKLFFAAYDSTSSYTMWTSDGTALGTTQFLTAASEPVALSYSPDFTVVGNELFGAFIDVVKIGGYSYSFSTLGETDGTAGGTLLVQSSANGDVTINQSPQFLANDNGTLVFSAYDSVHGDGLWQSDGSSAGTLLTTDFNVYYSNPQYLTVAGSQVFFNVNDGVHGAELWTATLGATVVTPGLSGPTDGVTQQHRDFVLTGSDSNSGNNSAGFSFAVDFGDGTTETIIGQSGLTADHQYATTGSFTVKVTATNLADNVTGAQTSLIDNITATEIQGGNLALGGLAGNNAFVITKGTGSSFNVSDNATTLLHNFTPATGEEILLYPGNGTITASVNDSGTTKDSFTLGTGYVTFNKGTFVATTPTTWTVNGNNSTLGNTFTIVGAATGSINGGAGPNTINVSTGGSLSGMLSAGSDTSKNLLSYAKYATSGVVVDLPLGSATAVDGGANGGISGIENVTGSTNGGDTPVGDANANKLTTLKGDNILIGGSGGGDTLTPGSKGIDILIAGTTNYDSNIAALQAILATWKTSTAANYSTVISTIESNTFADPLNTSTVADSGASDVADALAGSGVATTDWFFAHTAGTGNPKDTITGEGSGDTVTSI